jgi:hypothetical protein
MINSNRFLVFAQKISFPGLLYSSKALNLSYKLQKARVPRTNFKARTRASTTTRYYNQYIFITNILVVDRRRVKLGGLGQPKIGS